MFCLAWTAIFSLSCASTPKQEDITQAEMHNALASSYMNNNELNKAYIEFQKSLKLNPGNKETLNYLGYISSLFNKQDEAIDYYERALEVDPEYSEALNNLGVVYADREEWDKAVDYFSRTLDNPMHSTPAWTYSNLGYAYYRKGMYNEAASAIEESLIRNPVFLHAHYVYGLVHSATGNDSAAIENFKRAIGIQPAYMDAHWEIARIYMRQGLNAKALKHLKLVAESDTNLERSREASRHIKELTY
jgi:Tfp pilus assembly protein PilF